MPSFEAVFFVFQEVSCESARAMKYEPKAGLSESSMRLRPTPLSRLIFRGIMLIELLIIKVIAAVAVLGLAIRVFIWEAQSIAAAFKRLRRQIGI
jgi:hypothetical protein